MPTIKSARLVAFAFVCLAALLASCERIDKKVFDYHDADLHGPWGHVNASLRHVVLGEHVDRIGTGTFSLHLSASSLAPEVDRVSVVSIELRRKDDGQVAYPYEGGPDPVDPDRVAGLFSSGRVRLAYTDYEVTALLEVRSVHGVTRERASGVLATDYKHHKTFAYWEALMGV